MWAERERGMMRLFLEDLRHYMSQPRTGTGDAAHYAHITELTVRLHFLTAIFSPVGSPQHFRWLFNTCKLKETMYLTWHYIQTFNDITHYLPTIPKKLDQIKSGTTWLLHYRRHETRALDSLYLITKIRGLTAWFILIVSCLNKNWRHIT